MEKMMYVAPAVEVLEVMVEVGFNGSNGGQFGDLPSGGIE